MKPSHYTTPRTMADCTFIEGYRQAQLREERWFEAWDTAIAWMATVVFLGWVAYSVWG